MSVSFFSRIVLILSAAVSAFAGQPPVVNVTAPAPGASVIGPTSVSLSATATSATSTISSVTFYQGTTKLAALTKAPYSYTWKSVAAGVYSITAVAKDAAGLSSTSAAVSLTVVQDQPPTVSMVAPLNESMLIGPTSIPMSATASSPDVSVASVAFYNGSTKLATITKAPYQYTWKAVAAGSYTLTAVATDSLGIATTSAPVAVTVKQDVPPTVSLTSPTMGFTTIGPATLTLTADASSPDVNIASVAFYQGATKLATLKTAPYTYAWKGVEPGSYSLTAVATDTLGLSTTSTAVNALVTQDPPPVVSLTSPTAGYTTIGPATVTLAATASSPAETLASVAFYQGATKLATLTKVPYQYSWKSVPAGTYSLTAVATDNLGTATTSSPVSITVNTDQPPIIAILTPLSGAFYASPASIALSASASSPDVSITSVAYYNGTTKLATVTTAPYAHTWTSVAAGTYSLTAVATDSVGVTTTSAPISVTVAAAGASTVKLTAPTNNKALAAPASVTLTATATAAAGVASVGFYSGNTLLGTSTTSPYSYSWQNVPAGTYNLTAVETDKQGGTLTSAPITFISDTPPAVQLTAPRAGTVFAGPATVNLAATVVDSGKISKVEFYQGTTLLGTSTTAPYATVWTSAPVGTYSLTAKAYDSLGIIGTSPATSVQIINDVPPVVTLLTPQSGLSVAANANVSLSYAATDSSTTIQKVELYRAGTLVATLTTPTSGSTWTFTEANPLPVGSYAYYAKAYDATGASADSAITTVSVLPLVPYATDFEGADAFTVGPLAGQVGWAVPQGTASIAIGNAYSGSQAIQLAAGTSAAIAQQAFASTSGESIVYCDLYAQPAVEASISSSTVFTAEQAQFGFVQTNGQALLEVYQGNGAGGGTWAQTAFTAPLNANNQTAAWIDLTARLDFTRKTWDLYANGKMVAADVPFVSNASTSFQTFQAQGDAATDSFFDYLNIGATNPLFADVNNDGIDDAWETQYGLSLATNDRYLNLSGDGVPIVQDYVSGANPIVNTKVTPVPVQSGLQLHLRADAAVLTDSSGHVTQWLDQSGNGNNAVQTQVAEEPQLATSQINGLPSLSFTGSNALSLPYNMLGSATAGEIISVVRVGSNPNQFQMLWNFGTGFGSSYYNGLHYEDFGTSDTSAVQEDPTEIAQYFIYDTSIDSTGTEIFRYNGIPEWTRTGLTVGFQPYPDIGGYGTGSFVGNVAEVIVYNRTLSDAERTTIGSYLLSKYAFPTITLPVAPSDLAASALSSDKVDLAWTLSNRSMHTVTTIYRETGSAGFSQIAQVSDASSYVDTTVTAGATYSYHITVQSYAGASGVSNTTTVTTPAAVSDLPQTGLTLWLRATAGTQGAGSLATWEDQSGLNNNAVPKSLTSEPQVIENQVNGLPVVRFNGANALSLPQNMLQTAQAGHIIAVVVSGHLKTSQPWSLQNQPL